ncbi:MAG: hypothetical protein ACTHMM_05305 [Agriterribacter sp.]
MEELTRAEKIAIYNSKKLNNVWLMFLLLGWSYGSMKQMGKQIFYYLTLGGIGMWTLYRLFTLNGKVRQYHRNLALELGLKDEAALLV